MMNQIRKQGASKTGEKEESEGVLRDVLQELDRERVLRAELECRLTKLESRLNNVTRDVNEELHLKSEGAIKQKEVKDPETEREPMIEESSVECQEKKVEETDERQKTLASEELIAGLIHQVEELKQKEREHNREALQKVETACSPALKRAQHEIVALKTERNALIQLIDALTSDCDAIQHAAANHSEPTLPLHIIRLLEITPWDPLAQQYANITKEAYEWQVYVPNQGWSSKIIHFPASLQILSALHKRINLTDHHPPGHQSQEDICFDHALSPSAVLTNHDATKILHPHLDFSLPSYGTWRWIGAWKVDFQEQIIPTGPNAWSYSSDIKHLISNNTSQCFASPNSFHHIVPLAKYRRRRWIKQCVLISYPCIGEKAKHFLSLMAYNASLALTVDKLTAQLLDMQANLADTEDSLLCYQQLQKQVNKELHDKHATIEPSNLIPSISLTGITPDQPLKNTNTTSKSHLNSISSQSSPSKEQHDDTKSEELPSDPHLNNTTTTFNNSNSTGSPSKGEQPEKELPSQPSLNGTPTASKSQSNCITPSPPKQENKTEENFLQWNVFSKNPFLEKIVQHRPQQWTRFHWEEQLLRRKKK